MYLRKGNTMQGPDKRTIQKQRTMRYFIEAAVDIINKEGIDNVTIRKVADLAGYNSATLYNYFDDLNHLLFLAALTFVNEYIEALPDYIKYVKNAEEMYLQVWDCFLDYAFLQPSIYNVWFFSELKNSVRVYVSQFYELYPFDIKSFPEEIRKMLKTASARNRSRVLLDDCVQEDFVNPSRVDPIIDITHSVLHAILADVEKQNILAGEGKEKCRNYIHLIYNKLKK